MKEGESNVVRFKFRANPKPTAGVWKLGEKSVPVGAADADNTVTSSDIENGVSLEINFNYCTLLLKDGLNP